MCHSTTEEVALNPYTGRLHRELNRAIGEQGPLMPPSWPRFTKGQIVGPLAGWHWMVVAVDVDEQVLALKPVKATEP